MIRSFITATFQSAKSAVKSFFLLDQCRREKTVEDTLLRGRNLDEELSQHVDRCVVCSKTYKRI